MMIPAAFDYQDPADTERGWDDEDTRVDECVHGEHPIECSMCTSAGFHAAVSGEEEDMQDPDKSHWTGKPEAKTEDDLFTMPLGGMTVLELVSARDRVVAELKRRAPELERELEMVSSALSGKTPRKTRKDAGTTRPRKTEAA